MLLAGFGIFASALAFALLGQSIWVVESYSDGIGVWVGIIGGAVALLGGLVATGNAPYGSRKPLVAKVNWGMPVAAVVALLLVVGSAFGVGDAERSTQYGWYFDERVQSIQRTSADVPPDIQAEIERLEAEAGDDINLQIVAAQEITNLINSIQTGDLVVHTGVDSEGPGLGWLSIGLAGLGVATSFMTAGALGLDERRRWIGATLTAGLGLALMIVPMGFTLGIVRVATGANPLAGIGAFVTFIAGFVVFAIGRSVLKEFRRNKIYADVEIVDARVETVHGLGAADAQDAQEVILVGQ